MTTTTSSTYQPTDAEVTAQVILAGRDLRSFDDPQSTRDRILVDRLKDELAAAYDDDTGYGEGDDMVGMVISDSIKPIAAATRVVMARALLAEHRLDGWTPAVPVTPDEGRVAAEVLAALDAVPGPDPRIAGRDERLKAEIAHSYGLLYDGDGAAVLDEMLTVAQKDSRAILRAVVTRALRAELAVGSEEFLAVHLARPTDDEVDTVMSELRRERDADTGYRQRAERVAAARTLLAACYEARHSKMTGQSDAPIQEFTDAVTAPFQAATDTMVRRFLSARNGIDPAILKTAPKPNGDEVAVVATTALHDAGGLCDHDKAVWVEAHDHVKGTGGQELVDRLALDVAADAMFLLRAATHCALSVEAARML